jgi:hypothetical protein
MPPIAILILQGTHLLSALYVCARPTILKRSLKNLARSTENCPYRKPQLPLLSPPVAPVLTPIGIHLTHDQSTIRTLTAPRAEAPRELHRNIRNVCERWRRCMRKWCAFLGNGEKGQEETPWVERTSTDEAGRMAILWTARVGDGGRGDWRNDIKNSTSTPIPDIVSRGKIVVEC